MNFISYFIILLINILIIQGKTDYECIKSYNDELLNQNPPDNLQFWYEKGKEECLNYLKSTEFQNRLISDKLQPYIHLNYGPNARRECRGVSMMYHLTKELPWVFGPDCSTYNSCWKGILTCSLEEDHKTHEERITTFKNNYKYIIDENLKNSDLTITRWNNLKFTGWSLKALRLQFRVSGPEVVSLRQQIVSINDNTDVIIGRYMLTIPGTYKVFARLLDIYLMSLYDWTTQERNNGYDLWLGVYLGGTETRCLPNKPCDVQKTCCGCDAKALLPFIPSTFEVKDQYAKCYSSFSETFKKFLTKSPPKCTRGDHKGRWIDVPSIIKEKCHPEGYTNKSFAKQWMTEEYQNGIKSALSPEQVWSDMHQILKKKKTTFENRLKESIISPLIHLLELSRYSNGNICQLYYIGPEAPEHDGRLQVFAPYDCQYDLYGRKEGLQCLLKTNRKFSFFQGDSQIRDVSDHIAGLLGISVYSPDLLKHMTNVKNIKDIVQSTDDATFYFNCASNYNDFPNGLRTLANSKDHYGLYVTDFGLSHNTLNHMDFERLRKKIRSTVLYNFWKDHHVNSSKSIPTTSPLPKVRIYQTGPLESGLFAIPGGLGEVLKRMDDAVLKIFEEELGFIRFDFYEFTVGKEDFMDGWHMRSVASRMAGMILLNMMCKS